MHISRSEQKRQIKEVEQMIEALSTLPENVLRQAPCEAEIIDYLVEAAHLSASPRQRQIKYITKLLLKNNADLDPLYALLSQHQGKVLAERKQLHTLELYRDALVDEALEQARIQDEAGELLHSPVLEELRQKLPCLDTVALGRLAQAFARTRNPRHSREIFRTLRAAAELEERRAKKDQAF